MGIAYDEMHAGERRNFLGSALRVASRDNDFGLGILAANAANCSTRVLVGSGGDGAGIEDNERGLGGGCGARQSSLLELSFKSGAVRLSGATAEVFYKESGHTLWYRTNSAGTYQGGGPRSS